MAKYIKKTTVVEAFQAGNISNWGELGILATSDYIIRLEDNSVKTLDAVTFENLYQQAPDTTPLVGTIDWA